MNHKQMTAIDLSRLGKPVKGLLHSSLSVTSFGHNQFTSLMIHKERVRHSNLSLIMPFLVFVL